MADSKEKKSNRALLEELGIEIAPTKKAAFSPREERIIAGFEEIQAFVEKHGRRPQHGEGNDIFERLYATRLDQIMQQDECRNLVQHLDHQGLLACDLTINEPPAKYSTDKELLAQLGIEAPKEGDITHLKHVKSQAQKKAAEEIASRIPCADFARYKPMFEKVQNDLNQGVREAKLLTKNAQIKEGDWFILLGQKVYVAELSEERTHGFDKNDYRLRVIYDNATESDLLLRSLQKALYEDQAGRRIVTRSVGPLFDNVAVDDDNQSGTIYVLRSKSELPLIAQNRDVIHKLGVTGGSINKRLANVNKDSTYLMAEVEIAATYELFNINRQKLEKLLHRFFESARLDIEINDRFGQPVKPREWFLVPLFVIDEVVEKIRDGTLVEYRYDRDAAQLVKVADNSSR